MNISFIILNLLLAFSTCLCQEVPCDTQNSLLHKRTDKCYPKLSQGPCGKNMVLYPHPTKPKMGLCDCAHETTDVPLVFIPKLRRCYQLYEEGYCGSGNWLTLGKGGQPICEVRQCQIQKNEVKYVPFHGRCVPLLHPDQDCPTRKHVVAFVQGNSSPKCISTKIHTSKLMKRRTERN